jgi:preprotein translocase subunit SecD
MGVTLDTRQVALRVATDSVSSRPAVSFAFIGQSANDLATFTAANIQKPMCIVLDNTVVSCPVIQSALVGGSGEITTNTREDAEKILNQLKYGSLPSRCQLSQVAPCQPHFGANSVQASIVAGLVGLIIVAVFMIVYYRLPGLLATIALHHLHDYHFCRAQTCTHHAHLIGYRRVHSSRLAWRLMPTC